MLVNQAKEYRAFEVQIMFDKNSLEAIELMVDLHNDVNDDALKLISEYCLLYTSPSPRD